MKRNQETAVFIDGANIYATAKALGVKVDYQHLLDYFTNSYDLVGASYYTAVRDRGEIDNLRPLFDWLELNGYKLVQKPVKEFVDDHGRVKMKGNMDIEITVDAMELSDHIKNAFFFTGDGDFKPLILALQRRGVRCTVVSTIVTKPPMCADELRRAANHFIDLIEFVETMKPTKVSRYA